MHTVVTAADLAVELVPQLPIDLEVRVTSDRGLCVRSAASGEDYHFGWTGVARTEHVLSILQLWHAAGCPKPTAEWAFCLRGGE
ncbi:MAG TPA: hypothetical protein VD930_09760 [Gemmatimonadales bacterium]|nr:hypothetical protein [Gemmatimonadales bacterium]